MISLAASNFGFIVGRVFGVFRLPAAITPHWLQIAGNSLPKIILYGIFSFRFYRWNQIKLNPLAYTLRTKTSPNLLRRPTRVDNTADNADIIQSQAANHHWLLSHATLGLVECRKKSACAQIVERFKPNTVLWTFHTIQPSSIRFACVRHILITSNQYFKFCCVLSAVK